MGRIFSVAPLRESARKHLITLCYLQIFISKTICYYSRYPIQLEAFVSLQEQNQDEGFDTQVDG
jgi:hypothetical protein